MGANIYLYPPNASWVLIGSTIAAGGSPIMRVNTTSARNYKLLKIYFQGMTEAPCLDWGIRLNEDATVNYFTTTGLVNSVMGWSYLNSHTTYFKSMLLSDAEPNLFEFTLSQTPLDNHIQILGHMVYMLQYAFLSGIFVNAGATFAADIIDFVASQNFKVGSRVDVYGVY